MSTILIRLEDDPNHDNKRKVLEALDSAGIAGRAHGENSISVKDSYPKVANALGEDLPVESLHGLEIDIPRVALAGREDARSVINVDHAVFGKQEFIVVAGPCSVESTEQMVRTARDVAAAGASVLRGGLFKPRTSPYSFQGLRGTGVEAVKEAKEASGLPFVTEVLDPRDVDLLQGAAEMLQVGARNMQNFELLKEVGKTGLPVLLKRGMSATIDETLLAAEYVMDAGNPNVVLCERGIRTFEASYRFTLDISAIPVLQERTHLPVLVDPSHAAGTTRWVTPLALAAAAAGADGIILEAHCDPTAARCDANQAYPSNELHILMERLRVAAASAGRTVSKGNHHTVSPIQAPWRATA